MEITPDIKIIRSPEQRAELIKKARAKWTLEQRKYINPLDFFRPLALPELNQMAFINSDKKKKSAFGGNRSGKTKTGAYYVVKKLLSKPNFQARASTWADMSIPIQQKAIYDMLPKNKGIIFNFNEKTGFYRRLIEFPNKSILRFKTYEQGWRTYQGAGLDLEWDDEEAPEDILKEQKMRIADRNGELIRTMTPLNGITYTYDEVIENAIKDPEVEYWFWDNRFNYFVNQESLQMTVNSYGKKEAEVRQQGHFLELTAGQAYYAFSDENIFDYEFEYMNYRPLEISCDFNVGLQSWTIGQEKQGNDYEFDYIEMEDFANTEQMCLDLKDRYKHHQGTFVFYGDIAGSQRSPETSQTNWSIIQREFPNAILHYQPIRNIKDRVDAMNGRLCNSRNERRSFIHKSLIRLIKDCRQVTWEMLLNKNKAGKLTHASDGVSYKYYWKYPLVTQHRVRVYE